MNYRNIVVRQTQVLEQQFKDRCIISENGGLFLITAELLTSTKNIKEADQWVLDMNQNPIYIQNIANFYDRAYNIYYTALADFGTSFNQLKSQRSVESILEL
jgi:hypothetical protein